MMKKINIIQSGKKLLIFILKDLIELITSIDIMIMKLQGIKIRNLEKVLMINKLEMMISQLLLLFKIKEPKGEL
jgi:hypothetical protein